MGGVAISEPGDGSLRQRPSKAQAAAGSTPVRSTTLQGLFLMIDFAVECNTAAPIGRNAVQRKDTDYWHCRRTFWRAESRERGTDWPSIARFLRETAVYRFGGRP